MAPNDALLERPRRVECKTHELCVALADTISDDALITEAPQMRSRVRDRFSTRKVHLHFVLCGVRGVRSLDTMTTAGGRKRLDRAEHRISMISLAWASEFEASNNEY
uniref:Transposase n=1 Tax=Steinernema glaseri TaxID=37863 RepID=A0A1I7Z1H5_9BILA